MGIENLIEGGQDSLCQRYGRVRLLGSRQLSLRRCGALRLGSVPFTALPNSACVAKLRCGAFDVLLHLILSSRERARLKWVSSFARGSWDTARATIANTSCDWLHCVDMFDWYREVDTERYAVTRERSSHVIGYAFQNADETWSIELNGKVVEVLFGSFRCAANALLTFNEKPH